MITVNNLNICYKSKETLTYLLKDICFTLNDGQCLGIIGKSGAGKSTLAKALLQIYDDNVFLESGEILINNIPFNKYMRGKMISLLFQNPNSYLNPLMKVGKQIEEMLTYHFKENKKVAKKKTLEIMEKVGIKDASTIYNYYPSEISGGMQQRICLCICLICVPKILILDESTSFLDKETKEDILKLIKCLQKEYNFTLIMISHDFKEIFSMCDTIAIINNGEMIEFAKKEELVLHPSHPCTIELLYDYLRYYKNIDKFTFTDINIETPAPIQYLSDNHYVRSWHLSNKISFNIPDNFKKVKEEIYEHIRS